MRISASQYDAFWRCPERYRVSRCVVPFDTPAPLALGRAFHAAVELVRKGDGSRVGAVLSGDEPAPDGEMLRLTAAQADDVSAWTANYFRQAEKLEVLATEAWFEVALPGAAHTLVGRLDGIVRDAASRVWVSELKTDKTANPDKLAREWRQRMQFRAEMLGARTLVGAEPVAGIRVEVLGKTGANRLTVLPLRYSESELSAAALDLAATADIIELLRATRPDGPWPHPALVWPCLVEGACEYETVCQHSGAPEPDGTEWTRPGTPNIPKDLSCSTIVELPTATTS